MKPVGEAREGKLGSKVGRLGRRNGAWPADKLLGWEGDTFGPFGPFTPFGPFGPFEPFGPFGPFGPFV